MKTFASLFIAFVVAIGAPGAFAQHAPEDVDPVAHPRIEDEAQSPQERMPSQRPEQAIYKGVVGNLLEAVPMDAEQRVELQRANAVVSTPFTVRSAALLLGIANPVVMIGGLLWGIWAASQIEKPAESAPVAARGEVTVAVSGD